MTTKQYQLNKGDQIPTFELYDHEGNLFSSDELYEAPAIIYFYPKDDTPGCTKEACSFRDSLEKFRDLRVRVVGISPDGIESHKAFQEKYDINFSLLSDPDHKVADSFDVWQNGKIERSTFLIDDEGHVKWIERGVKVDGHVERLMHAIRQYTNLEPME